MLLSSVLLSNKKHVLLSKEKPPFCLKNRICVLFAYYFSWKNCY